MKDYAQTLSVTPGTSHLSESAEQIGQLLKRRRQLMNDRSREQARADKTLPPTIKLSIQAHITWLN